MGKRSRRRSPQAVTPPGVRNRARVGTAAFVLAATAAGFFFHLAYQGVPDPDAFTHVRQASLYASRGLFDSSFPWIAFSVVSRLNADLWYGFHLLLLPFSFLPGPFLQLKMAGGLSLSLLLITLWWALRRLEVKLAWLWPFVFLLASPGHLWRLQMTRPHLLSTGLAVLLLSFLIRGRAWQVGLIALGLSFVHLTLFWLAPVIVAAYLLVAAVAERRLDWRPAAAAMGGCALGCLLRPNPIGALQLLSVQLAQVARVQQQGIPLLFSPELFPMELGRVPVNYPEPLLFWLAAVGLCIWALLRRARVRSPREPRLLLWCSLLLSLGSFNMMCQMSRRAADMWLTFAVILLAAAFTVVGNTVRESTRKAARSGAMAAAIASVLLLVNMATGALRGDAAQMARTPTPARLQGAGLWLRAHAPPGAIVFNSVMGDFAELFYWDPDNRYVGGLDPIFQYAYSPQLSWKAQHITQADALPATCGEQECTAANREDIHTVLQRDFRAPYLAVDAELSAPLLAYLRTDPRFAIRYEDQQAAVVEVLTPR